MELWKVIEGFEAYAVSNLGRVRRAVDGVHSKAGRLLKAFPDGVRGYLQVCLWADGKNHTQKVHRLVAKAFIPNPLGLPEVNHVGKRTDNRYFRLEWRSKAGHKYDQTLRGQKGSGVRFYWPHRRWLTTYSVNGKLKHIGYYDTKEEAKIAHDTAIKSLPYIL